MGGYEITGAEDTSSCRWFSFSLTPASAPWAFVREGQAYRAIAALELFGTLLCLILFVDRNRKDSSVVITFSGCSDNQGNEALMNKTSTSKFPLYIVLLELTEQLQVRNMNLDLRWIGRQFNQHADDLSNRLFDNFNPDLRINPKLDDLDWLVLPQLMTDAIELDRLIKVAKVAKAESKRRLLGEVQTPEKRRKQPGLKTRDPW